MSREICEKGMFVALNGFEYQVLMDIQQIHDKPDHRYKILCDYLNGKGCEDISEHNGLRGIRERTEAVGGTVRFSSIKGEGFNTMIKIPLQG